MSSHAAGKSQHEAVLLHLRSAPAGAQHVEHPSKAQRRTRTWAKPQGWICVLGVPMRPISTGFLLPIRPRGIWLPTTYGPREGHGQEHPAMWPAFLRLAF